MTLKLTDETEKRLVASIKRFFDEEMDEPIGELKALRLLDFCLREIAPSVYNQAIADAQGYFTDQRRRPQWQPATRPSSTTGARSEPRRTLGFWPLAPATKGGPPGGRRPEDGRRLRR